MDLAHTIHMSSEVTFVLKLLVTIWDGTGISARPASVAGAARLVLVGNYRRPAAGCPRVREMIIASKRG